MPQEEYRVNELDHRVDFPLLSTQEVQRRVQASAGVDLVSLLVDITENVRADCGEGCCYLATLAAKGSGCCVLQADCSAALRPDCRQREDEHFKKALGPIKEAFKNREPPR